MRSERLTGAAQSAAPQLAPGRAENRRLWGRRALGSLALMVALASVVFHAQDRRVRRQAEQFARSAGLTRDRPDDVEAIALEPAGDLAAAAAVAAAVSKEAGVSVMEGSAGIDSRQPLPEALSVEELRAARDRMLDAVALRPGWADHRYLLGLVDFEEARRSSDRATRSGRWARTLRLATKAAPGMDVPWMALGEAELESWSDLSPADRGEAPEVFRRCFVNDTFVASRFRDVTAAIGRSQAIGLLPEESASLEAAAQSLARQGDVAGSAILLSRTEKAERKERTDDLLKLEERRRLGDVVGLRIGCQAWFGRHPYREFDDPPGRAQVVRLLELWPDDRIGFWSGDPRAQLLRFFLDGRESEIRGETLLRTTESLTGVPDPVRARVALLAGDLSSAQALARGAGTPTSLEWSPYFLELARRELAKGRFTQARAALQRLSFGARGECDTLLLRRQVARALEEREELTAVERGLQLLRAPPVEDWASRGAVSICLDPESSAGKSLEVRVSAGAPAILSYGWDGGRLATVSLSNEASAFRVPLGRLSGWHSLWVSFLIGGRGRTLRASVQAPS